MLSCYFSDYEIYRMLAAVTLLSIPSSLPKSRLPSSVDAPLRPTASVPPSASFPTHILAVSSSKTSPSSPSTPTASSFAAQAQQASSTVVPLYPTHSLVLAAHCTLLPRLPAARASTTRATALSLPVVPLTVPDAATFPHLHAYLHTKRADTLLATLLPALQGMLPPAAGASSGAVRSYAAQFTGDSLLRYAHALASYAYTQSGPQGAAQTLMAHARVVNGLWKNTCALGIFDTELWAMMDLAWEIILTALTRIVEMSRR